MGGWEVAIRRVVPTFETGIYFPKNAKTSKILFYKVVQKKYKYSNNRVIFFSIAFTEFVNVGAAHTSNHPLSTGRSVEKYIFRRSLMDVSRYLEDVLRKSIPLANPPPEEWQGGDKRRGKEEEEEKPILTPPRRLREGWVGWGRKGPEGDFKRVGGGKKSISTLCRQTDSQVPRKKSLAKELFLNIVCYFPNLLQPQIPPSSYHSDPPPGKYAFSNRDVSRERWPIRSVG